LNSKVSLSKVKFRNGELHYESTYLLVSRILKIACPSWTKYKNV